MIFFKQRKPRRFHHQYLYVDERKERLREIERKAREELGMKESSDHADPHQDML